MMKIAWIMRSVYAPAYLPGIAEFLFIILSIPVLKYPRQDRNDGSVVTAMVVLV